MLQKQIFKLFEDECGDPTLCPEYNSICTNSDGSFECSCIQGFQRIGEKCENINECERSNWSPSIENAEPCWGRCGETLGPCPSYCKGYCCKANRPDMCPQAAMNVLTSTSSQCLVPPDPCSTKPNSNCHDNPGSYECRCTSGYENDEDLNQCVDIDECQRNIHNCPENSICSNLSS